MNRKRILLGFLLGLLCFVVSCQVRISESKTTTSSASETIVDIDDFSAFMANNPLWFAQTGEQQKSVAAINRYANLPLNYEYFDYRQKALDLDRVLFRFAANPTAIQPSFNPYDIASWNPLGFWIDQPRQPSGYDPLNTGYLRRTFGLPTYLGDNRVVSSGSGADYGFVRGPRQFACGHRQEQSSIRIDDL
ncbi:MAG: hypothetical protein MZU97_01145 [Bacillus subtilis]|nr:hypothetical protein [Bacillus subtilis]